MDEKSKKTKRAEENVVSSGVTPTGKTRKDEKPVVKSGVAVTPKPTTQIISAGIVSAAGGEIVLNGKNYKILQPVARSTGEAEVYLLEREGKKYIFKYYLPAFKPKDTILKQLKGVTHEDIIDLIDYGYYHDRFFEILEYAEGGTLLEVNPDGAYKYIPIKDMDRLKQIIKEIVNALEFCHSKGIVHRDLKPENIFFTNPDGTDIQIGDFGISSSLDEGLSKHLTGQARTEIYAAPELYQSIGGKTVISKEVDYYALGITLVHIFSGEEPFKDLSAYAIMKIKCDGKVDIPDDAPEDLKTLIKGLITVEPSKRWGYKEVQKWLRGEYVPAHYKKVETKYGDFHFGVIKGEEIVINEPAELAKLLEKYPQKGKKHLYKGTIAKWVEPVNQALYIEIGEIVEEKFPQNEEAGLIKAIYVLDPLKNYKTFAGVECRTAEEIGDAIEREASYYKRYLTEDKNADLFLYLEARGEKDVADAFRKYAQAYNPERAFNLMVLELQGRDKFKMGNLIFHKPEDLLAADDATKNKLAKLLTNPDSKLSIWLEQFGELKNNINKWRKIGRFDAVTLSYALEKDSPFHIEGEVARDVAEFKSIFSKHLTKKDFLEKIAPDSSFVKEADFWLKNYHNTNFYKVLIGYLTSKAKAPLTDEEKEIFESLAVLWIEKLHSERDITKRDEMINILKKLEPNNRWVIRKKKEERLIDIMKKNKMEELLNKGNAELEKIRKEKKEKEKKLRKEFKEREYEYLWREDGKWAFLTGIGTMVLWTTVLLTGADAKSIWLSGAGVGGIIGGILLSIDMAKEDERYWLGGALVGLFLGGLIGGVLPFIFLSLVPFLFFLIKVLIKSHKIKKKALQIELDYYEKEKFKKRELDVRNKIENERKTSRKKIMNKISRMDEEEIDKGLESLGRE